MKKLAVTLALTLSLMACQAQAQTPLDHATELAIDRAFNDAERAAVEEYFNVTVPKSEDIYGKKEKVILPPGVDQHIKKNNKIPPGTKKGDIPSELYDRVPVCQRPKNSCAIIGSDMVLLDTDTDVVLDLIANAVR